jgi:hypothetical protein
MVAQLESGEISSGRGQNLFNLELSFDPPQFNFWLRHWSSKIISFGLFIYSRRSSQSSSVVKEQKNNQINSHSEYVEQLVGDGVGAHGRQNRAGNEG